MVITCTDCGSLQRLPRLPPRGAATCHRCDRVLERRVGTRFDVGFECQAAALLLLPPAFFLPLMSATIKYLVFESSRLVASVGVIYRQVWYPLAVGFLLFAFVLPAVRAALLLVVLGSLRWRRRAREIGRLFRWSEELRIWSMTDIVVIAGLLTYFRAAAPAEVEVEIGAWCYLAVAALVFVADRTLDVRAVWSGILRDPQTPPEGTGRACPVCELTVGAAVGRHCPRCGGLLEPDVRRAFALALALVAAAIPLAVPAYTYSVLVNERITGVWEHSVLGTVRMLADQGLWQLGAVVLLAGVLLPLTILAILVWLLLRVRFPDRPGLVRRTRVYRLAHGLVRWPMVIPFLAALAAPIIDFEGLDEIFAGPGVSPYFLFMVLLILAMRLFEPRLMWRTAGLTR